MERKTYPLRLPLEIFKAVQAVADAESRTANGQIIEWIKRGLREAETEKEPA